MASRSLFEGKENISTTTSKFPRSKSTISKAINKNTSPPTTNTKIHQPHVHPTSSTNQPQSKSNFRTPIRSTRMSVPHANPLRSAATTTPFLLSSKQRSQIMIRPSKQSIVPDPPKSVVPIISVPAPAAVPAPKMDDFKIPDNIKEISAKSPSKCLSPPPSRNSHTEDCRSATPHRKIKTPRLDIDRTPLRLKLDGALPMTLEEGEQLKMETISESIFKNLKEKTDIRIDEEKRKFEELLRSAHSTWEEEKNQTLENLQANAVEQQEYLRSVLENWQREKITLLEQMDRFKQGQELEKASLLEEISILKDEQFRVQMEMRKSFVEQLTLGFTEQFEKRQEEKREMQNMMEHRISELASDMKLMIEKKQDEYLAEKEGLMNEVQLLKDKIQQAEIKMESGQKEGSRGKKRVALLVEDGSPVKSDEQSNDEYDEEHDGGKRGEKRQSVLTFTKKSSPPKTRAAHPRRAKAKKK
eukprot:TRINITY_DN15953_c0_g1_i1.p1 TRINITY_DN15953_c0_g1~~TRINITY_DN15953_c0_g1_i1.p1  ORF type:complete len:471 (-),score=141.02 TRINITY_DN15953_c0_g1_i1:163-1575(-)